VFDRVIGYWPPSAGLAYLFLTPVFCAETVVRAELVLCALGVVRAVLITPSAFPVSPMIVRFFRLRDGDPWCRVVDSAIDLIAIHSPQREPGHDSLPKPNQPFHPTHG
jgi:hypothetical protein